ncbi:MAG: twin-arginine translocase subunit TatC [Methanocellales archaeon]
MLAMSPDLPSDKKMPLLEHIIELRNRMLRVVVVFIVIAFLAFPFTNSIIAAIWAYLIPEGVKMVIYEPLEFLIVQIMLALIIASSIGIPFLIYELFQYASPGLYPHEKRYFFLIVPFSVLLFIAGVLIGFFIVLPIFFHLMVYYSNEVAVPMLSIGRTFSVVITFLAGLGLVFQLPLLVIFALKLGLVKRSDLIKQRPLIYGALIAFAIYISPDPTMFSQLIVGVFLVLLFEISLLIAKIL